jgi:hypothetical protein
MSPFLLGNPGDRRKSNSSLINFFTKHQ